MTLHGVTCLTYRYLPLQARSVENRIAAAVSAQSTRLLREASQQSHCSNGGSSQASDGSNGCASASHSARVEDGRGGSASISAQALLELSADDFETATTVANRAAAVLPGGGGKL